MPEPEIRFIHTGEMPKPKTAPHLVCGFPGSGFVGKLAVDHLIEELKATRLVDIYSSSFPPQVLIGADGTAELMKNSIFWWEGDDASLLLLTGDTQPQNPDSEYALASQILDFAGNLGMKQVFTLAAYITGVFVEKPRVFGTATDTETVAGFANNNVSAMDSGSITGMNGLVIGIAKMRGLKGTCLLGETSGYVVDAKASKAVLEVLLKLINLKVDMANLDKRAKDTEMLIQTIEQQMSGRARPASEGQQRPQNTGYIS
ncbi:proteasome assembly chaperone family protein [Nitrososphaera sp.]|uniref:proteasome assembly chaperone family protein n=1 Tax=Nitrososphaera sp. TaxID=1971748 RepID=UPI00179B4388|nr:proteasome assembly chaperone family protein [Nitrososphaera sp.]NWG37148.1 proteasome assembly chaperone family protein [Nitrososphaera sp.]